MRVRLKLVGSLLLGCLVAACSPTAPVSPTAAPIQSRAPQPERSAARLITLSLAGDVMTGRGIDQILPYPGDPTLFEPYLQSAVGYVQIAEQATGPLQIPVSFAYPWGDALAVWEREQPDLRIVNLETTITTSDEYRRRKTIHYRMNPANIPVLTVAKIDFVSLANNHILDWGIAGLAETLDSLQGAGIRSAGAGSTRQEAESPALFPIAGKGRVIIFSFGHPSSGTPTDWAATASQPGVNLLDDLDAETVLRIKTQVESVKQTGDIVVFSIHWGANWVYDVPAEHIEFAHRLIDQAGVDLVHGHSSHHVMPIEVYRDKLIIYGAGDLLNDYEGIGGYEEFRPDLALLYFAAVDPTTGKLVQLRMTPFQIRHMRLNRASPADARWLAEMLTTRGERFGTRVGLDSDNTLFLETKSEGN